MKDGRNFWAFARFMMPIALADYPSLSGEILPILGNRFSPADGCSGAPKNKGELGINDYFYWWAMRDSNPRPLVPETNALSI